MYSRDNCEYCNKARALLTKWSVIELKLGVDYDRDQLLAYVTEGLGKAPASLTVPQIWIHGQYIGGYDDLVNYLEECSGGFGDGAL